ncbi:hypothetical protein ACOJCM_14755 [Billgrantia sp. LNSP4103-1]|uniref:hypothetical protein n=1 Tax=Billgrantia sp. LNSP4103-1 TaxID=3410266 RepID=UPI00403FBE13
MPRHSLASLEKRLEALETVHAEPPEIWVAPSEMEIAGWELLPGNSLSENVMRLTGESDEDLKGRARAAMRELWRQGGARNAAAIYFAIKPSGVTL